MGLPSNFWKIKFNKHREEKKLNFRRSDQNDTGISMIYKENHISFGGRLVSELEYPDTITYVAEIENKVMAYINIMEHLPDRITEKTRFGDRGYCFPDKALYIRQVAVHKAYQNKGIGKKCYQELHKLYPDMPFYAFVDIRNTHSLKFHIRNGFFPVGIYEVAQFWETPNYTAFLLEK